MRRHPLTNRSRTAPRLCRRADLKRMTRTLNCSGISGRWVTASSWMLLSSEARSGRKFCVRSSSATSLMGRRKSGTTKLLLQPERFRTFEEGHTLLSSV